MRIEVEDGQRSVNTGSRPQQRQGDGVITAQSEDPSALCRELPGLGVNPLDCRVDPVWPHSEVAGVDDLPVPEGKGVVELVVGVKLARVLADVRWAESCTGAETGARIEGNAHDREISVVDLFDPRQQCKGGDPGVTRKLLRLSLAQDLSVVVHGWLLRYVGFLGLSSLVLVVQHPHVLVDQLDHGLGGGGEAVGVAGDHREGLDQGRVEAGPGQVLGVAESLGDRN